jgi:endonuclease YncB( thermonuclease family)
MRRLVVMVLALVAAAGVSAAPAAARSGSCMVPGAKLRCSIWTGKVTFIGDGDTIYVDVDDDGSARRIPVRFTGLNAMEQTVYSANPAARRGDCHALEATARIEQLIRAAGGRVRLAAQDASSASRRRWRREVAVRVGGRWRDLGRVLLSEGLAVWMPNRYEWYWNRGYAKLAEQAAAAHRGLWDGTSCGRGPQEAARLALTVNSDADGDDGENLNGEWVRIRNLDAAMSVLLGGWMIQQSSPGRYVLPDWLTLPPGEELTIHVGSGMDTWTELFLGRDTPMFDNAAKHFVGDGAYLFDPQGDVRAWSTFPCRLACRDPHAGALRIAVAPRGRESVTVRNVSAAPIDLDGYRLLSSPHVYAFPRASVVGPGQTLTVEVTGDPDEDTQLVKSWGKPGSIFTNARGRVSLTNLRGVVVDCFAWGTRTC